jgi:hypothetical protein
MIGALVAAATMALPSREDLIERWVRANPAHAASRLESPARAAAAPPDLHALAQRELNAARYRLTEPSFVASEPWWVRAIDWLGDRWQQFIGSIFRRVHISQRQAVGIGDALLVLVGIALLSVVVSIVRNVRLRRTVRVAAEPIASSLSSRALYNQACDAASRGDYGVAALLLFGAMVALLDRGGAVAGSRSATVGDLRRDLRLANAKLVVSFDAIAAPFVERAYAERAVSAPQWQQARAAFDNLNVMLSER